MKLCGGGGKEKLTYVSQIQEVNLKDLVIEYDGGLNMMAIDQVRSSNCQVTPEFLACANEWLVELFTEIKKLEKKQVSGKHEFGCLGDTQEEKSRKHH